MVRTETTLSKTEGVTTSIEYDDRKEYDADELAAIASSIALTIAHRINREFKNRGREITIPEIIRRISANMQVMEKDYQRQQAENKRLLTQ